MTQQIPEQPLPLSRWVNRRRQQISARLFVLHERSRQITDQLQLDGIEAEEATLAGTSELLKRLLSAEKHLRQILVDHPAAVLVVDREGMVQLSNAATRELLQAMGVAQADLYKGKPVDAVFPGALTEDQIELPAHPDRCDAEHLVMVVKRTPVTWGRAPATLILLHDVTPQVDAQRKLEQALEQKEEANRLKSEFITMASHEFRTPLTGVLSSLDLMEEYLRRSGASLPAEVLQPLQKHIGRSRDSVGYLDKMVQDMLVLEKTHGGGFQCRPETISVRPALETALRALEPLAEQQASEVQSSVTPADLVAELDPDLLRHILTNLVSNALLYTPSACRVEVTVVRAQDAVVLAVADNGPGLSAMDQQHLFETFYRGARSHAAKGSGLGLPIVKRFVELHQGEITVQSAPEQGTTFRIVFPQPLKSGVST